MYCVVCLILCLGILSVVCLVTSLNYIVLVDFVVVSFLPSRSLLPLWLRQIKASIFLMLMTLLCARKRTTFRYFGQRVCKGGGERESRK